MSLIACNYVILIALRSRRFAIVRQDLGNMLQNVTPWQALGHKIPGREIEIQELFIELDLGHSAAFSTRKELDRAVMQQDDFFRQRQAQTETRGLAGLEG